MHIILSPLCKINIIRGIILNMHHYDTRCLKNEFKLNDTLILFFLFSHIHFLLFFHINISNFYIIKLFYTLTSHYKYVVVVHLYTASIIAVSAVFHSQNPT